MTAYVLRADARSLPLPDASVDLIVTSPPYFGLRSYTDGGEHYDGQIGSEATPAEFIAALTACTREWVRVLKPSGSLFVNLGDKYSNGGRTYYAPGSKHLGETVQGVQRPDDGAAPKSLLGLPWRYALACTDQLGLILRRDIIWHKPNGLPESVTDRCRSSHEYVFHLVRQPRYYAAVDEIREPHAPQSIARTKRNRFAPDLSQLGVGSPNTLNPADACNPLGKLPGSVWSIPSAPLAVPAHLGIDHFAAFPPALVRPIVLGWSPPGICLECGEGRRPVSTTAYVNDRSRKRVDLRTGFDRHMVTHRRPTFSDGPGATTITGYACACTPFHWQEDDTGRWKVYHFGRWTPPPTRPAVVLDPFAGTGTVMLVASTHGRTGIGVDRSMDYCRLARWRVNDPGERARALNVPKPPPVPADQEPLFSLADLPP